MKNLVLLKKLDKYLFGFCAGAIGIFCAPFRTTKLPKSIKNILIIKLWALGDSVNTIPLIKALKDKYPEANIDVLVTEKNAIIYQGQDFINNIMIMENKKFFSYFSLFKKYDLAFDLEPFLNLSALTAWFCAKKRAGFTHGIRNLLYQFPTRFKKDQHIVNTYLDMARYFGINKNNNLVKLHYDEKAKAEVQRLRQINGIPPQATVIGICPSVGASIKEREWPKERFRKLAEQIIKSPPDRLKEKQLFIALIGTEEDQPLCEFVKNHQPKIINFAGKISTEELFCFLEQCAIFISNDTGPMHIAAAMGTKTIGLFGPNTPKIWAPFGKNNISIFHPGRGIPFLDNTKHDLIAKELTSEQKNCMENITVDEVYKAL